MQVNDELIQSVVREVLSHMRNGQVKSSNGQTQSQDVTIRSQGVFD